ncbi:MAG: Na/Pi cotransporter family protein [Gammaproteobacteria bacterium]|nr:Na/Pi cotransporter family protein [Gammaproteobacteria bacterium]
MHYSFFDFLTLLGSLGLFLYGMKVMSDALMELAGDRMRNILATATSNRFFAVSTGFTITAIIQSSSATTLMVVSFANASLLSLTESIGVIMGANIGTTVTAWLISLLGFKVNMASLAIPLVGAGFLLSFSQQKNIKHWGYFIIGFAILFIGLEYLKNSVPDLKSSPEALAFLGEYTSKGFLSVVLFMLIGTVLTVVIQSSSATMAITIIMCFEGWIPFDMAAAMVLGENIGTTITANMAALVANYRAKRTAMAHFIFNIVGVVWVLVLFSPFLQMIDFAVQKIEGASPFEQAIAIPVALSLFHTIFNVVNTSLLIGFVPLIGKVVKRMVPEVVEKIAIIEQPHFLDSSSLNYPQTGLKAVLDESLRLLEKTAYKVITHGLNVHRKEIESDEELQSVIKHIHNIELNVDTIYYNKFKNIYSKIVAYATKLQGNFDLDEEKIIALRSILRADRLMVEIVKDIKPLHRNMNRYLQSENEYIRDEYNKLRKMVLKILRLSRKAKSTQLEEDHLQKCNELKAHVETRDVLINGTVDRLIRENLISNEMATSLMNDSSIAIQIARNLIDVSTLLYTQRDVLHDVEEDDEQTDEAKASV